MTPSSAEYPANLDALQRDLPGASGANGTAQEVDHCLAELAQLAQSELPERDFYSTFLDRVIRLLAAEGGAAWRINPSAPPGLIARAGLPLPLVDGAQPSDRLRQNPAWGAACRLASVRPRVGPFSVRSSSPVAVNPEHADRRCSNADRDSGSA